MEKNQAYLALDEIGWGLYNLRLFLQCGLALIVYDCMFIGLAYFLQGAYEEWNVSSTILGIIASLYHVGMLFGNLTWGFTSDKKGRKLPFRLVSILGLLAGIIICASFNQYMLASGILLLGFSMSGELNLAPTVFCEFCPPSKRNLLTLLYFFLSIGAIIVSVVALIVVYLNNTQYHNWRIICASILILLILNTISKFFIQETPPFLCRISEFDKAEIILNKISNRNAKKPFTFDTVSFITTNAHDKQSHLIKQSLLTEMQENPPISVLFKRLFSKRLIRTTLKLSAAMCLCLFSFAGFVNFMPELLNFLSTSEAYLVITIQQAAGVPGALIGAYLVKTRLGRKWTTFIGFLFAGIFNVLFTLVQEFYYVIYKKAAVTTSVIFLFTNMGYSAISTLAAESFPTQVRSTGTSFLSIFARLAGISGPIISGVLLGTKGGSLILMCLFGASNIACAIIVTSLKETNKKVDSSKVIE